MPMSKDRVHFLLKDSPKNVQATARAAEKAFGIPFSKARAALDNNYKPMKIICRPSQFARFLIYRSQEVSCNTFSQFQAELLPQHCDETLDVSGNPAEAC